MRLSVSKPDRAEPRHRASAFLSFIRKYKYIHIMAIPCILYLIVFHYVPMYGILIAFTEYKGTGGFWGIINSKWVGFENFTGFFNSIYFWRVLKNTLVISLLRILFGFPAPILLALLLNEIRSRHFKRVVQTITYMPHFLSWVVIAGLLITLLSPTDGPVNAILMAMGFEPINFISSNSHFRGLLIISGIWRNIGWGTIIYMAAITGINSELYEAAVVDGASKWKQIWHVTLPGIAEVVAIMLILAMGKLFEDNFEQIFNLYNEAVYEVSDVLETFIYRQGIQQAQYSYSAAIGLFKSVAALIMVYLSDRMAKKLGSQGLW